MTLFLLLTTVAKKSDARRLATAALQHRVDHAQDVDARLIVAKAGAWSYARPAQIALSWYIVLRCSIEEETHDRHLINVTIACAISTLSTLL